MLQIITSTNDDLHKDVNIDNIKRPWTPPFSRKLI